MKKQLKLSAKLAFGFGGLILIIMVVGAAGYYSSGRNAQTIKNVTGESIPALESLQIIAQQGNIIKTAQRTLLNLGIAPAIHERQYLLVANAREAYQSARKRFDAISRTPEEDRLWNEFQAAWQLYRTNNDVFFDLTREMEALKVGDPLQLERDLALFRGDHYKLERQVLSMLDTKQVIEGGDDHTACRFGKWSATQKYENPDIVNGLKEIAVFHRHFHEAVKKAKNMVKDGDLAGAKNVYASEMEASANETLARFDQMLKTSTKAVALSDKMSTQALVTCRDSQLNVETLLATLVKMNRQEAEEDCKNAVVLCDFFQSFSLVAIIVGVVLGIGLAWVLTRSITIPIRGLIGDLANGADQIASAAGQVSSASQLLAEGASEQAASLEETSSSLEEMASMTKNNAESAGKVNELGRQTRVAAESGVKDMEALYAAMEAIKKSSDEIAKIIKTSDEIAFQTNILALNAAVEAARAGEAGMGFAVVAEEVRNLAQRSAHASHETAEKIQGAINNAAQGVQLSEKVALGLKNIEAKARQVDELAAEVAAASKEQSLGIDQINVAISQMDKVTQSNAANAEEGASASEEMNAQSMTLKESVDKLLNLTEGSAAV